MQGLAIILVILGEKLRSLIVDGYTGLLHDFKFRFLWMVPELQLLHLKDVAHTIDQADFEQGILCVR